MIVGGVARGEDEEEEIMDDAKRDDDLAEAARIEALLPTLSGKLRDDLEEEARALRAAHGPPPETVALAIASASAREADLAEADRLEAVAQTLRPGPARQAVEDEAAALRARWPDFPDDVEGQVRRLAVYLLGRGVAAPVPARAAVELIAGLDAELAEARAASGHPCPGCGLPQPKAGSAPLNAYLVGAVETFEVDGGFREQVLTGQVQPGQSTHPWVPRAEPHRGPNPSPSPWALPTLSTQLRAEPRAAAKAGPRLRAALAERGLALPAPSPARPAGAALARPN